MIETSATVSLAEVEAGLERMHRAGVDLRALFRSVRKELREDQRAHAKEQRGPGGAWPTLAASTVEHRKARAGKQGRKRRRKLKTATAKKLGRLPGAYKIEISRLSIKAISRVKWSGAHQGGARVGHGSNLPDRTFLWASSGLLEAVARRVMAYLEASWEGRRT